MGFVMFKLLRSWFWTVVSLLADALQILGWQGVVGMTGSFALPAWAASATAWLNAWGPIAWVACGFLGLLLFVSAMLLWGRFRLYQVSARLASELAAEADAVNPLADHFERKRVRLSQLASPIDGLIDSKVFSRCEILGPANVAIIDGIVMQDNELHQCDFVVIKSGARITANVIKLRSCTFRWNGFHSVTFLVLPNFAQNVGLQGANWITELPLSGNEERASNPTQGELPSLPPPPSTE
jgi:hypothetical protein